MTINQYTLKYTKTNLTMLNCLINTSFMTMNYYNLSNNIYKFKKQHY